MGFAEAMERGDRLQRPLAASLAFHAAITGVFLGWSWYQNRPGMRIGDNTGIPGAVSVSLTDTIPMMTRGPRNRVANDTESQTPAKAKPEPKVKEVEDEDAVALGRNKKKERTKKKREPVVAQNRYREEPERPNQMTSTTGAQASAAIFTPLSAGGGGVGVGTGSAFGTQFGYYGKLITERIAQKWKTQDIDARLQTAPTATVSFEIMRDGATRSVEIVKSSGNYAIDTSARRAVMEASPFPPLPNGFDRNSAVIEINFLLKR